MVSRVTTIAFEGIEAIPVDVQVMVAPGKMGIQIVGLADKAVAESRERVQAALHASGLSMPAKKVTVNLAPADLPKEGSHYDLPIALGLMAALGAIPADAATYYIHDVALLPSFRGGGLARRGVLRLLEIARHFDRTGLIAVYDAAHFWARFGFVASNRVARAKLAAYGEGAAYMEKQAAPAVAG